MTTQAFNTQVIDSSTSLKPIALSLTKDSEDANDLIQETMLRAISSKDKFREGTNLKAWLYTIMKNIFINNYRRKMKRNTIIDTTDNNYFINSTDRTIYNNGESNLNMEDIDKAFSRMSPDFKVPFLMHFKGFKYQEIANDLELPIGTVKSRIHFARKELKGKLKGYYKSKA
ncbi:MAG: RNA polymerase sigma factor [Bacteroidia bacterium]